MSLRLRDRLFERLQAADEWCHHRDIGPWRLCWLVGKLEPGYYGRNTDWAHPIYERPTAAWTQDNRRIANKALVEALLDYWATVPDQRFGQLVMNLSREPGGFADTWEWGHQRWLDAISEGLARGAQAKPSTASEGSSGLEARRV